MLLLIANNLIAQQPPSQDELNKKLISFCPWPGHPPASPQELESLLADGVDPNYIVNPYRQETLLDMLASDDTYNEHIKIIIKHCQHIKQQLKIGNALHSTVYLPAILNATALLEAGANVNALTEYHDTPLQLLILYSVSTLSSYKRKPSEWHIRMQIAKLFIDNGARMDIVPEKKTIGDICSPIQLAMEKNLPEFVQLFRKKIAEPDHTKLIKLKAKHPDQYISLLPIELLVEVSYMMSNEEFETQKKGRP